jgi:hypothetical protein
MIVVRRRHLIAVMQAFGVPDIVQSYLTTIVFGVNLLRKKRGVSSFNCMYEKRM